MTLAKLKLLAERGDAYTQYCLGDMYARGIGVAKDDQEAFYWLDKAATQGYAGAQQKIGEKHLEGSGVPRDLVQAYMWFDLAAAQGNKDAKGFMEAAARDMKPAQIEEARRLAREWKPVTTVGAPPQE